ncbi:hypothetical protein M758_3G016900 [Ceratodon purpureus]|uniref:cytokinin dehydrogenase n=1 Tax=Ceratodon purpureus TaxID=3225 RepID=A0A8T0IHF4_CERPU|nr:hypothetical protein KC19_3G017000 [Ceratodon purpureus]KAG0621396.1 hypothetical protein M758_3G016900 [Ceratodon purpureus]
MADTQFRQHAATTGIMVVTRSLAPVVGWWTCVILILLSQINVACSSSHLTPSVIAATDRMFLESLALQGMQLSFDNTTAATKDWGKLRHLEPAAVVYPRGVEDIATIVQAVARSESDLTIAARGLGHSTNGQAQAHNGVVIQMTAMRGIRVMPLGDGASKGAPFVEAMGGDLWVDVLKASLEFGLAPKSWTDYLHLTIGGTLSNAGVSGQSFRHGPEISNVLQLEVVTGKGETVDCSPTQHPELFFATLGGLGQFGIITKARIALEKAPQRVRWVRALYTDFAAFRRDQEFLISAISPFDYVEGFVVANNANPINGWSSVPFEASDISEAMIPGHAGPILYCLEVTKAYSAADLHTIDEVVESMLAPLNFHRELLFKTDTSYFKFLDRLHETEVQLSSRGLWDQIPHPWLNLFVPASSIERFDMLVLKKIMTQDFSGPLLVYPLNKSKWDKRLSVAVPEGPDEIFYIVAFLRNKLPELDGGPTLSTMLEDNDNILRVCEPLRCKQYLPRHQDRIQWKRHFGSKWDLFVQNKQMFDPRAILSPGQNIFSRRRRLVQVDSV